jgi:hypothetical protein
MVTLQSLKLKFNQFKSLLRFKNSIKVILHQAQWYKIKVITSIPSYTTRDSRTVQMIITVDQRII